MPLETNIGTSSLPDELNPEWPLGSDAKSEGDDHIRNVKRTLLNFFNNMNYDNLPNGSIPATFNGVRDPSGMVVKGGGIDVSVPIDMEAAFVRDLVAGDKFAPVVFSPIGTNSRPFHVKTSELGPIDGQNIDTENSTIPDGVTVPVFTPMLTSTLVLRGAQEADRVRIVIRENDANGRILIKTATEQELAAGGGVLLNSTGDTVFNLEQFWISVPGDVVHITIERYDAVLGQMTTAGILLKGATIDGTFIPYFNRTGYRYELVPLREDTKFRIEDNTTRAIGSPTVLVSTTTFPSKVGRKYRYRAHMLMRSSGGQDALVNVRLSVNGLALDYDGANYIANCPIRNNAQLVPFTIEGTFEPGVDGDIPLNLSGYIAARSVDIVRASLEVDEVE